MSDLVYQKLSMMKKPELMKYVKDNRLQKAVPGYTSMRKGDLIRKLQEHIKIVDEPEPKPVVVEYELKKPVETPKPAIDDIKLELEKVKLERDEARGLLEKLAAYKRRAPQSASDSESDC